MIKTVVIDANAISRNLLSSVLLNGGYDVIGDANASSAGLASMVKLHPQIVCIDVGSAGSEDMAKLALLREELPKAMLFLVSGKLDPVAVQSALEHGVHGFIVKPFNAGTVLTTIRNAIIRLARQHRAAAGGNDSA